PGLDQTIAEAMARDVPLDTIEHEELGYDHAEVGGLLARRWKLPLEMQDAVSRHHVASYGELSLAGVVAAADAFVTANGLLPGYVVPPTPGETPLRTPEYLQLSRQV